MKAAENSQILTQNPVLVTLFHSVSTHSQPTAYILGIVTPASI